MELSLLTSSISQLPDLETDSRQSFAMINSSLGLPENIATPESWTLRHHPMLYPNRAGVCGSGQRAASPAAKTPVALVSNYSTTAIPRSIFKPACFAKAVAGRTRTPTTMKSV